MYGYRGSTGIVVLDRFTSAAGEGGTVMRKFVAVLLIVASLALAIGAVGCGNRLNLGTSSTMSNTSTTYESGGGN